MIWTDTFANNRQSDIFNTTLGENNARLAELNRQDIRVIVGNPPYSVGQESQNDDNQNEHYDELDARLTETYVARTDSTLKGKLYDSYIRAYRWASDRIGKKGVIGFVTNAGWLETSSADGMRKCMVEEFSSIYIYHLKGNARTQGEQRRKEKDNVFGEGSRAPVAIVFLVKNPDKSEHGKIYFHAVDDYLTREEKLDALKKDRSISYTPMNVIVPDDHGDWFNQRDDSISKYISMGGRNTSDKYIFKKPIVGVCTNRDTWIYGSSIRQIERNINRTTTHAAQTQSNQLLTHRSHRLQQFPIDIGADRNRTEGIEIFNRQTQLLLEKVSDVTHRRTTTGKQHPTRSITTVLRPPDIDGAADLTVQTRHHITGNLGYRRLKFRFRLLISSAQRHKAMAPLELFCFRKTNAELLGDLRGHRVTRNRNAADKSAVVVGDHQI